MTASRLGPDRGRGGVEGRCVVFVLCCAMLVFPPALRAAVEAETTEEKAEKLQQQSQPDLFQQWSFDELPADGKPTGFSSHGAGVQGAGSWHVRADTEALSAPNVVLAKADCQGPCTQMLIADGLQYEYPDLSVRLRATEGGTDSTGGLVFGWQDAQNFYAAVVDLQAKVVELSKVIGGKETVLGRVSVTLKASPWHVLRAQRNTIISKDFIEVSFDGRQAVSVQDQSLATGQIGLITKGKATLRFDNFHAVPLFSQRPLSSPGAY